MERLAFPGQESSGRLVAEGLHWNSSGNEFTTPELLLLGADVEVEFDELVR